MHQFVLFGLRLVCPSIGKFACWGTCLPTMGLVTAEWMVLVGVIAVLIGFPVGFWFATSHAFRSVIGISLGLHLIACVGLLVIAPATEANPDTSARIEWIATHPWWWRLHWVWWMATSTSFLLVCAAWRQQLSASVQLSPAVIGIAAIGVLCDLMGETVLVGLSLSPIESNEAFVATYRLYQWLSPAAANGLYCVAGAVLSWYGWGSGLLSKKAEWIAAFTWIAGGFLTVTTVVDWPIGMMVTGILTMVLFNLWLLLVAWESRVSDESAAVT